MLSAADGNVCNFYSAPARRLLSSFPRVVLLGARSAGSATRRAKHALSFSPLRTRTRVELSLSPPSHLSLALPPRF